MINSRQLTATPATKPIAMLTNAVLIYVTMNVTKSYRLTRQSHLQFRSSRHTDRQA